MAARHEKKASHRPAMVLAHVSPVYAARTQRHFRLLGWEVHWTTSGADARTLARAVRPALVILGTDLPDESGWLTCNKLVWERPDQKVILVREHVTKANQNFSQFVGAAAIVNQYDGVAPLADELRDSGFLPAAS